jgi:hypothetical protein
MLFYIIFSCIIHRYISIALPMQQNAPVQYYTLRRPEDISEEGFLSRGMV